LPRRRVKAASGGANHGCDGRIKLWRGEGTATMSDGASDEERLVHITRTLRQVAVFRDLDDDMLARVAGLARPLALPRGTHLNEPAAAVGSIYLIVEGCLRLYREAPTGRQVTLDLVASGEFFRFLARAADGGLASVAEAVGGRAVLYRFPGDRLLASLATSPEARARLGAGLARALTRAYDALTELVLYDAETRLARLLLRLAAEAGVSSADSGGDAGYVGATHEELAWRIGATREVVTHYARHFVVLGLIATKKGCHGIVVRATLAAYAQHLASRQRGEPRDASPQP